MPPRRTSNSAAHGVSTSSLDQQEAKSALDEHDASKHDDGNHDAQPEDVRGSAPPLRATRASPRRWLPSRSGRRKSTASPEPSREESGTQSSHDDPRPPRSKGRGSGSSQRNSRHAGRHRDSKALSKSRRSKAFKKENHQMDLLATLGGNDDRYYFDGAYHNGEYHNDEHDEDDHHDQEQDDDEHHRQHHSDHCERPHKRRRHSNGGHKSQPHGPPASLPNRNAADSRVPIIPSLPPSGKGLRDPLQHLNNRPPARHGRPRSQSRHSNAAGAVSKQSWPSEPVDTVDLTGSKDDDDDHVGDRDLEHDNQNGHGNGNPDTPKPSTRGGSDEAAQAEESQQQAPTATTQADNGVGVDRSSRLSSPESQAPLPGSASGSHHDSDDQQGQAAGHPNVEGNHEASSDKSKEDNRAFSLVQEFVEVNSTPSNVDTESAVSVSKAQQEQQKEPTVQSPETPPSRHEDAAFPTPSKSSKQPAGSFKRKTAPASPQRRSPRLRHLSAARPTIDQYTSRIAKNLADFLKAPLPKKKLKKHPHFASVPKTKASRQPDDLAADDRMQKPFQAPQTLDRSVFAGMKTTASSKTTISNGRPKQSKDMVSPPAKADMQPELHNAPGDESKQSKDKDADSPVIDLCDDDGDDDNKDHSGKDSNDGKVETGSNSRSAHAQQLAKEPPKEAPETHRTPRSKNDASLNSNANNSSAASKGKQNTNPNGSGRNSTGDVQSVGSVDTQPSSPAHSIDAPLKMKSQQSRAPTLPVIKVADQPKPPSDKPSSQNRVDIAEKMPPKNAADGAGMKTPSKLDSGNTSSQCGAFDYGEDSDEASAGNASPKSMADTHKRLTDEHPVPAAAAKPKAKLRISKSGNPDKKSKPRNPIKDQYLVDRAFDMNSNSHTVTLVNQMADEVDSKPSDGGNAQPPKTDQAKPVAPDTTHKPVQPAENSAKGAGDGSDLLRRYAENAMAPVGSRARSMPGLPVRGTLRKARGSFSSAGHSQKLKRFQDAKSPSTSDDDEDSQQQQKKPSVLKLSKQNGKRIRNPHRLSNAAITPKIKHPADVKKSLSSTKKKGNKIRMPCVGNGFMATCRESAGGRPVSPPPVNASKAAQRQPTTPEPTHHNTSSKPAQKQNNNNTITIDSSDDETGDANLDETLAQLHRNKSQIPLKRLAIGADVHMTDCKVLLDRDEGILKITFAKKVEETGTQRTRARRCKAKKMEFKTIVLDIPLVAKTKKLQSYQDILVDLKFNAYSASSSDESNKPPSESDSNSIKDSDQSGKASAEVDPMKTEKSKKRKGGRSETSDMVNVIVMRFSMGYLMDACEVNGLDQNDERATHDQIGLEFKNAEDLHKLRHAMVQMEQVGEAMAGEESQMMAGDMLDYAPLFLRDDMFIDSTDDLSPEKRKGRGTYSSMRDDHVLMEYPFACDSELLEAVTESFDDAKAHHTSVESDTEATNLAVSRVTGVRDSTESKSRGHYVTIRVMDYERLDPEKYLNDSLIDFWMQWISRHEPKNSTRFHFFTSHFFTKLMKDGYQAVQSWTAKRGINIFEKKMIFLPVNRRYHWSLCVVINPSHILGRSKGTERPDDPYPCLIFLDSLKIHKKDMVHRHVLKWLNAEYNRMNSIPDDTEPIFTKANFPVLCPKVPIQTNGWDCGIFVCKYAGAMFKLRDKNFSRLAAGIVDEPPQSKAPANNAAQDSHVPISSKPREARRIASPFQELIVNSEHFDFNMDHIHEFRDKFAAMLVKLSDLYAGMKQGEKAKKNTTEDKEHVSTGPHEEVAVASRNITTPIKYADADDDPMEGVELTDVDDRNKPVVHDLVQASPPVDTGLVVQTGANLGVVVAVIPVATPIERRSNPGIAAINRAAAIKPIDMTESPMEQPIPRKRGLAQKQVNDANGGAVRGGVYGDVETADV